MILTEAAKARRNQASENSENKADYKVIFTCLEGEASARPSPESHRRVTHIAGGGGGLFLLVVGRGGVGGGERLRGLVSYFWETTL